MTIELAENKSPLADNNVSKDAIETNSIERAPSNTMDVMEGKIDDLESHEVFQATTEGVNFRTVSWQRATIIFLKIQFAMSILSVPAALVTLGAVGGSLSIVGWQLVNTCMYISEYGASSSTEWALTMRYRYCCRFRGLQK